MGNEDPRLESRRAARKAIEQLELDLRNVQLLSGMRLNTIEAQTRENAALKDAINKASVRNSTILAANDELQSKLKLTEISRTVLQQRNDCQSRYIGQYQLALEKVCREKENIADDAQKIINKLHADISAAEQSVNRYRRYEFETGEPARGNMSIYFDQTAKIAKAEKTLTLQEDQIYALRLENVKLRKSEARRLNQIDALQVILKSKNAELDRRFQNQIESVAKVLKLEKEVRLWREYSALPMLSHILYADNPFIDEMLKNSVDKPIRGAVV